MKLNDLASLRGSMTTTARGRGYVTNGPRVPKKAAPTEAADDTDEGIGGAIEPAPVPRINRMIGEYKPSLAMRIAIERAHRDQPPMRMLTSVVQRDPRQLDFS